MKRSDINEILGHTRQFFSMHDVHLPPFASFPPTKWQQLDQAAWQEVFDLKLGWDVTAFGGNSFAAQGLTLFTLRNGSPNGVPYEKGYAEKIMFGHDKYNKLGGFYGGAYGYTRFPTFAIPALREMGYEKEAQLITVANPARFLSHS